MTVPSLNSYRLRSQRYQQNQNNNRRLAPVDYQMTCNYCKRVGHFKNQCSKLRKFNSNNSRWIGGSRGQRGKAVIQLAPEPDFCGVEEQDLSKGNVSLTKETRGKIGIALHVSDFIGSDTWIIDSGASDHMTYNKSFFVSMSSPSISHVFNANGASFPVLGIGSIQITPSIMLHDVLYVPSLSHHLLSVSQLNSQNKCSVTFYPMYVVFQNLCNRVIIGKGGLRGRLFHLDCMYAGQTQAPEQPLALTLSSDRLSETPEQNGVSERKNRHLLDMARSLLLSANMPKYLWGEAVLCASHLINRLPSAPLQGRVPLEMSYS